MIEKTENHQPEHIDSSADAGHHAWIKYALVTIVLWGVWGAIISIPEAHGFPAELGYVMWAASMTLPAFFALRSIKWQLDISATAVIYGSIVGLLGGIGQLILYSGAIANGPAYLIFPIIALSPVVTILMSLLFLREKATGRGWAGIALALVAVPLLNYSSPESVAAGSSWLVYALLVFLMWGIQGFYLKFANMKIQAESIFFYMALTSLLLAPFAWAMLDSPSDANWEWDGAGFAFGIGLLNAVGALFLVYAFRYGKAIVVSPVLNCLPPIVTSILSLIIMAVIPSKIVAIGMLIALISAYLLAVED